MLSFLLNSVFPHEMPAPTSLFVADLLDVLENEQISQADYARACNLSPSSIQDIVRGRTLVSTLNLGPLLGGVPFKFRARLLLAHLNDVVPEEYRDEIRIERRYPSVEESTHDEVWTPAFEHAFQQLPSATQRELYHFAKALRTDAQLRKVFSGTLRYVLPTVPGSATVPK